MNMATTPDITGQATGLHFAGQSDASSSASTQPGELKLISAKQTTDRRFIAKWQTLAAEASEPNPFFEPWCLIPALKHLHRGARLSLFAFIVGGRLRGLMPIEQSSDYYGYRIPHATAWRHDSAFCGAPLVARGYEQDFWHAILARFDQKPGRAAFLHLPQLPAEGPMARALDAVIARDGRHMATVETKTRAMLASDITNPEVYLDVAMKAETRKELNQKFRRLSERGELLLERREDTADIVNWSEEFLALEASDTEDGAASAHHRDGDNDSAANRFFAETMLRAAKAGRLERLALRLDGRPIAMLASFVTPPGAFAFKTTFDAAFAEFSPGQLLQMENLVLLERGDIDWADSCAPKEQPTNEPIWREKRTMISRNVAIGSGVRRFVFRQLAAYETRQRR